MKTIQKYHRKICTQCTTTCKYTQKGMEFTIYSAREPLHTRNISWYDHLVLKICPSLLRTKAKLFHNVACYIILILRHPYLQKSDK